MFTLFSCFPNPSHAALSWMSGHQMVRCPLSYAGRAACAGRAV